MQSLYNELVERSLLDPFVVSMLDNDGSLDSCHDIVADLGDTYIFVYLFHKISQASGFEGKNL